MYAFVILFFFSWWRAFWLSFISIHYKGNSYICIFENIIYAPRGLFWHLTWLDSFTFNFSFKKRFFWGRLFFSMEFSHCWVKEPYPKSYKLSWTWKMLHCKKEPYLSGGHWGSKLHKDRQTSCYFYIIIIIQKYWIFLGEWCLL